MNKIFDPNNKFNIFMSRVWDLMVLNLLFLITSLPIVTIGAASTALYTVCFRFGTEREEGTVKSYFQAFRDNLKQSTALGLILAVFLGLSLFSLMFFYGAEGMIHSLYFIPAFGLGLGILVFCMAFPLLSQFDNTLGATLKNSLILGIAYLPKVLVLAILHLLPFALFFLDLYVFMRIGFIFFLFHFAFTAYAGAKLLKKPFQVLVDNASEEEPA